MAALVACAYLQSPGFWAQTISEGFGFFSGSVLVPKIFFASVGRKE